MKGIIRKTREEIIIVSYHSRADRDDVLDYVSYIDSKGVEHPREKLNLYWDIEVIDENKGLIKQQVETVTLAGENLKKQIENNFSKRESVALNIYSSIISEIFAKAGSNHWSPDEVADLTEQYTSTFMERFIKEEKK